MGGPAKMGKTFLLMDLAHELGEGGKMWGTEFEIKEAVTTLYVEQEIGMYEFQRRLKNRYNALGGRVPQNVFVLSKVPGMMLDTARGIEILRREIQAVGAKVVILDPISRFMIGSENDNTQVQVLIRQLDELVGSVPDLSIVMSHHFGKPPASKEAAEDYDPLSAYNFRGASKWFDAPDTLITFQSLPTRGTEWKRMRAGFELRQGPSPAPKSFVVADGGPVHLASHESMQAAVGAVKNPWKR